MDQQEEQGTRVRRGKLGMQSHPLLLPQFIVKDDAVTFGLTRLKDATPHERRFANRCDGVTPFREIVAENRLVGGIAATAPYLTWLQEPLDSVPGATSGEKWLVISPHPDDAEVSMGGTILNKSASTQITNLVVFSHLAHTLYMQSFGRPVEVTATRKDEALLAGQIMGCDTQFLEFPEFGLREALIPAKDLEDREQELREHVKFRLYKWIEEHRPDQVFAPASVGDHPDHRMIFDLILQFVDEDFFPETTFHFYEDFPYAAAYQQVDDFLSRFEHSYLDVEPWAEDISAALETKQTLGDIYRTQFRRGLARTLEEMAARTAAMTSPKEAPVKAAERFWRVGVFAVSAGGGSTWTSS